MRKGTARLCALGIVAGVASGWYPVRSSLPREPARDCPGAYVAFVDRGQVRVDCSAPAGARVVRMPLGAARALRLPVDLDVLTAEELESLPGIGPALARRIVDDRRQNGPFRTVEDLGRVRGIGPAKVAALRDALTLTRR